MNTTSPITDDATDAQPAVHDRRALLGKLALGGAGAAIGASLLASNTAKAAPAPLGTTFVPISPERSYDSRQPNYAEGGLLDRESSRVVSVADGHSADGTVTTEDVVPETAVAVLINLTATAMTAGNYLAVTAGDVETTATSVLNWPDEATQIANAISVPIDAERSVRVHCGDQVGSTHFIVDVFGYYLPIEPEPPV